MIGRSEFPKDTPFMERISFEPTSGCWLWEGSLDGKGYGQYTDPSTKKRVRAHRYSYEMNLDQPIPAGLELDHLCHNRACVNPDHLEPVSHRENTLRGTAPPAINAVKERCPQGHEYTLENTNSNRGTRKCRECDKNTKTKLRRSRGIPEKDPTKCKHGHPFDEKNTRIRKGGIKSCRECDRLRHAIKYAQKRRTNGQAPEDHA